jgi:hypothetical protein
LIEKEDQLHPEFEVLRAFVAVANAGASIAAGSGST